MVFIGVILAAVFILATVASRGMGLIFNEVMARQTMLNGTVTVESLSAAPWGTVSFENLVWTNREGVTLLTVPSGKFRVNMWDVITRNFKASAVREIILEHAVVVVDLDDNMRLDFAPPSPDVQKDLIEVEQRPKPPKKSTAERQEELGRRVRNFNWQGQHLDMKIELRDCQLELFQKNRHYVMKDFNAKIDMDSRRAVNMTLSSGKFGGTAIGDGLELSGRIDLNGLSRGIMPTVDMKLDIHGVDPSSLGFGDNIHDKMTLLTHVTGDINRPLAKGRVTMPVLRIPALTFNNVVGDVTYQDGILNFVEVFATVYNGKLQARGIYNLDTRAYEISGTAKDLDSAIALKTPEFEVPVSANLNFKSDGKPRDLEVWGNFWSGNGHYVLIPIKSITGQFHNQGRHLSFSDVKVQTNISTITTDALHIDNGELTMGPLNITSNGGSNFILYDQDSYEGLDETMDRVKNGFSRAQKNGAAAQADAKAMRQTMPSDTGIGDSMEDLKRSVSNVLEHMKDIRLP